MMLRPRPGTPRSRSAGLVGSVCTAVVLSGLGLTAMVTAASPASAALSTESHQDNPYANAVGYVNPEWKAKAESVTGGNRVSNTSTAVL